MDDLFFFKKKSQNFCKYNFLYYLCYMKHEKNQNTMKNQQIEIKKIEQENTYQVLYSDGVTILDYILASNLQEAKRIAAENAKTKNYGTAYYKVARCYNGGVRGSSPYTHWH